MNALVKPPRSAGKGGRFGLLRRGESGNFQPGSLPLIKGRDREFLPAALEILETPPAPIPVALMLTLCAFTALALLWAFIGRLDIHAVATGKVEVNGRAKVIQPLDPGKIAEIRVETGMRVKAGDMLLAFDPTEAAADEKAASDALFASFAEIARRQAAIATARAKQAQTLQAQLIAQSAAPAPVPPGVNKAAIESGLKNYQAQALLVPAEINWTASGRAAVPLEIRLRESAVLNADIGQLQDTLANIGKQMAQKDATKARLNMSLDFQSELIKTLTARVGVREAAIKLDVGTRINLFDAQETLQKSQSALASDQGQLIETEAALEELRSQRVKVLSQFIADNETKLAEAARKADETAQQLAKARARLARTKVVSPIDGTVQQLAVTTIGQVVTTGQQLMLVTPDSGALQVEIFVSNIDIGFVRLGQEAAIKVDAFPFTRFGTLHGKVVRIATDAVDEVDARRGQASATALTSGAGQSAGNPGQPQSFVFPVTLSLDETAMNIGATSVRLTPGMTVTAEIKTDSRRVIDYLFSPLAKIASEAMRER